MSSIFNMKIAEEKTIKQGKKTKKLTIYDISRKNNQQMNMANFKDVYNVFKKKYGAENLLVRALNDTQWFSFKAFTDSGLNIQDFEEYYENRVAHTEKFNMFYQTQITVLSYVE